MLRAGPGTGSGVLVGKEVLGRPPYPALQYGNHATVQEGLAQGPGAGSTGGHTGRAKRLEGDPSPHVKEVGEGGPWEVSRVGVTCHGRVPAPQGCFFVVCVLSQALPAAVAAPLGDSLGVCLGEAWSSFGSCS